MNGDDAAGNRVILDTNVLLSAVFFGGVPRGIVDAWQRGLVTLVLSAEILAEYARAGAALSRRYAGSAAHLEPILAAVAQTALVVDAPPLPRSISPDPDDDKFLACPLAADVRTIVSGDKPLRSVSGWAGIEILSPRAFVDRYLGPAPAR